MCSGITRGGWRAGYSSFGSHGGTCVGGWGDPLCHRELGNTRLRRSKSLQCKGLFADVGRGGRGPECWLWQGSSNNTEPASPAPSSVLCT